ncbi:MAG: DUF2155 domain-containing protein [Roseiarcus sp.]|jgi:hypothetical protein
MNVIIRGAAASLLVGAALVAGPARADRIRQPTVVFAGLDKITGRIISFEVAIDETVQFGSLEITPRVCYTRPPTEAPRTDVFVEVDEVTEKHTFNRLFTGWMFASSPGLHGIEHPVYDIWLTDCKGSTQIIPSPPEESAAPEAAPPDAEPGAAPAGDAKPPPPPPPKKRKQAAAPVEATPLRAAPDPSVATPSGQRGGVVRRFFPTDDPPIPPGNVGQ